MFTQSGSSAASDGYKGQIGACALAPAVVVDGKVYGQVTPDEIVKVIDEIDAADKAEAAR